MKVLIINSVCGIGSTGRIATDLIKILKDRGDECKIVYGIGNASNANKEDTIKMNNKLGYYFHNAISRITDRAGFYSTFNTKRMIKKIENYNPDIIHLHNLHGYYINIRVLFEYLEKINKPVVWTLHDCWPITGHCVHFAKNNCEKWKIQCEKCQLKKTYPKSYLLDYSKKNYKQKKNLFTSINNLTIITPSKWLADLVKESYLGIFPIKVINNGIDLDIFKPQKSNFRIEHCLEGKKIILGVAGNWNKDKGLEDFINLSQSLDENYKIVMIGLSQTQLKNLPKSIIGIERTNSLQELAEIYSSADIFVNATYEDNFPTVNLESLACGTPIITYKTGGSVEAVDSKSGIVIPCGDLDALKQTIRNMPDFNKEDVRKRALCFSKEDKYNEYIKLYNNLIKSSNLEREREDL